MASQEYQQVLQQLIQFRDNHEWQKYHNLKDLALSLNLEASEVLEIFQWTSSDKKLDMKKKSHLQEELADVLIYCFYMCEKIDADPLELVKKKIAFNKNRHWKFDD